MKSRGEREFVKLPGFAARLYARMMRSRAIDRQYGEIATELASMLEQGRVLDVGTGPGRMLRELHRLNGRLELHGLDISRAMVELARRELASIPVTIRRGSIEHTDYEDGFFDLITCNGSLYLWERPVACLNEIHRILRPGGVACLYETHRDFTAAEFKPALKQNLRREGWLRRWITPIFLSKQLRMTYSREEIEVLLRASRFRDHYGLENISLGGLPIWLRITLRRSPRD